MAAAVSRVRTIGEHTIASGCGRSTQSRRPIRNTRSAARAACTRPAALSDGPGAPDPDRVRAVVASVSP